MQRLSVNRKSNRSCPKKSRQNTGTEKQTAHRSAAVTTECLRVPVVFRSVFRDQAGDGERDARCRRRREYGKDGQRGLVQPHSLRAERAGENDPVHEPEKFFCNGKCRHIDSGLIEIRLAQAAPAFRPSGAQYGSFARKSAELVSLYISLVFAEYALPRRLCFPPAFCGEGGACVWRMRGAYSSVSGIQ